MQKVSRLNALNCRLFALNDGKEQRAKNKEQCVTAKSFGSFRSFRSFGYVWLLDSLLHSSVDRDVADAQHLCVELVGHCLDDVSVSGVIVDVEELEGVFPEVEEFPFGL